MNDLIKKIRLIFLPFVCISILFVVFYTFLNWLLFIKTDSFSVKQDIIHFWLPIALPWIPILIWLRPRIKLLNLKYKSGSNIPLLYQIVAGAAICIPTIISQKYIETASGKLSAVNNVNEITKHASSKYYTIKNFYIDKQHIGVHPAFNISGKHNEHFNMHIYIAVPIFENKSDTSRADCNAWLGTEYYKSISNRLEDNEKEEQYQAFPRESQSNFDTKDVTQFIYLERAGNTDDGDGLKEAVKTQTKFKASADNIFLPVNEPYEARNGSKFEWIFGSFGIAGGIFFIMLLFPKFDEVEMERFQKGYSSNEGELKEAIEFFKPKEGFFITPIILYINVLIFVMMVIAGLGFISFKGEDLLHWGANFKPAVVQGEWWRLLTNIFLHGGFIHLAANMYGLFFVGIFLEPLLGKTKYLLVYLFTGLVASIASIFWYDATVSIGASGAIFGLYGLFLAFLLTKVFPPEFGKAFLGSTLIFIGYNLLMGFTGGIDNAAHIGGLVSGFAIGFLISPSVKKQQTPEPEP
jgi:rhomboid protease GluP